MGLVYGVGLNDFDGKVTHKGSSIVEYEIWRNMIKRCKNMNQQRYYDCKMDDRLLSFSYFYDLVRSLKGFNQLDNNNRIFQLDKDLLSGNEKIYSPETICFVPAEINSMVKEKNFKPTIEMSKKSFSFRSSVNGDRIRFTGFKTEEDALNAFFEIKDIHIKNVANKWKDLIDERVYWILMNYRII